jgi:hypothetical protein
MNKFIDPKLFNLTSSTKLKQIGTSQFDIIMQRKGRIITSYFVLLLITVSVAFGQDQDFDKVQIKTVKAAENVYMLLGSGGSIGVCTGGDGVFLVNDQFAPLTKKIKGAIG